MNRLSRLVFLLFLPLAACGPSEGERMIVEELEALRGDIHKLSEDIAEIKGQPGSRRPARPTRVTTPIAIGGYPALGGKDAPVTIAEFTDFQCPFCKRHTINTLPRIKKEMIETGKVRYVVVDNPIPSHRYAPKASEAAHCAGEQGKYWEMHHHIFENQQRIRPENFAVFASEVGLNPDDFGKCMDAGTHTAEVNAGRRIASSIGATGTPSFVIGKTRPDGKLTGDIVIGAKPYAAFADKVNALLN